MSQEQNNVERFLGVKGRKCRQYESNYHSSKGEMLALVYGLSKFDHLLRLKEFVVITDSNTVLHRSTMKDTGGTIRRWLDFIQQFNFTVVHREGKICSVVPVPWHLGTNKGEEGRGPALIASVKGKIIINALELSKAQQEDELFKW